MKRLLVIPLLLLVAATMPTFLVQVTLDGDVQIDYSRSRGETRPWDHGSWQVNLRDGNGELLGSNTFEPYGIDFRGDKALLDEVYVTIYANPLTQTLEVYDEQGRLRATKNVVAECGDRRCDEDEKDTCSEDCVFVQEIDEAIRTEEAEANATTNWAPYLLIGAMVFLVIILILIIIHLQRGRENPVVIDRIQ